MNNEGLNSSAGNAAAKIAEKLAGAVKEVRRRLREEREKGVPTEVKLNADIKQAAAEAEAIGARLEKAKRAINKRKDEIDMWKAWYAGLEQTDKSHELKQLEDEIGWRAGEIAQLEKEVGDTYPASVEAIGKAESLKIQLIALKEGVYERPVEEDPRLQSVLREHESALGNLRTSEEKRKENG